jgi:hypothetical protein
MKSQMHAVGTGCESRRMNNERIKSVEILELVMRLRVLQPLVLLHALIGKPLLLFLSSSNL